ncbi:MAG: hypothetical protein ACJ73N_14030 [Bryobacteraceae bacterium]
MSKSQIDSVALIAATLAGGLALLLIPSGLLWMTSLIGLILLLVLLAYDGDDRRSVFQTVAFSAVCGFCITLASIAVYEFLFKGIAPDFPQLTRTWLPITYVCATVLVLLVDFARMSARVGSTHPFDALHSPLASPPLSPKPPHAISQHAPASPVLVTEPPDEIIHPEPIEPRLVRNSEPARPIPDPIPVKPGKETNIYVNLVGEGLNMLRSVRAEHMGRDYYRIVEPMPESEQWEYGSGQVVRCRKKNLSSGKALVAVEEAPRAN